LHYPWHALVGILEYGEVVQKLKDSFFFCWKYVSGEISQVALSLACPSRDSGVWRSWAKAEDRKFLEYVSGEISIGCIILGML